MLQTHLPFNIDYEKIPQDKKECFIILLYLKTAILYRIGENKKSNNILIENYFTNTINKYNMTEDLSWLSTT